MKPTPFTLNLWILLGKPQTVYTRDNRRVKSLIWHENASQDGHIFSGILNDRLTLWDSNGISIKEGLFHSTDLLLRVEDKPFIKIKSGCK